MLDLFPPRHLNPEEQKAWWAERRRQKRRDTIFGITVVFVLALFLFGLALAHAIIVYDDWRCVVGECRIVKAAP